MIKPWQTGILVFSVDLEGDMQQRTRAAGHDDAVRRLIGLFAKYSLSATWAVADPAHSAATGIVLDAGEHEMAVMGDPSWAGNEAGRRRFGQELSRRVEGARANSVPVASLVLKDVNIDDQFDLLQKNQITAVRTSSEDDSKTKPHKPQLQRYGLWNLPVSCNLPSARRWLTKGTFAACRTIRRAVHNCSFVHVAVDAVQLRDVDSIDQVLRVAAAGRKEGHLSIETMGRLAQRLSAIRQIQPSRSILRPAA